MEVSKDLIKHDGLEMGTGVRFIRMSLSEAVTVFLPVGYYADPDMGCQAYHICLNQGSDARRVSFLCPNGTVFNQALLTCEWW